MTALNILAGERAYQHIKKEGLSPKDISVIFGASGAAKWLTICELDKIIFSQWLLDSNQPNNFNTFSSINKPSILLPSSLQLRFQMALLCSI